MPTKNVPDKLTDRLTPEIDVPENRYWYKDFLQQMAEFPNVSRACAYAGIARQTAYDAREVDPAFKAAWEMCVNASLDHLEQVAFQRAELGSDTLAIFLLKAHRPEKYRETQRHEHSGTDGSDLVLKVVYDD